MLRLSTVPAVAGALLADALFASALTFVPAAAQGAPAPISPAPISDVMVMTVCTDRADNILPGVAPTDPGCTRPRKLRPGETPPYRLSDFSPATVCPNQQGVVVTTNLPVSQGAKTRYVSFDSHVTRSGCQLRGNGTPFGASIEGSDGQFGFILGDDAPTGMVNFDSSSQCRLTPHSITRFARGWVIGPAILPAPRVPGHAAIRAMLTPGDPAAALQAPCPAGGQLALTAWVLDDMTFTEGFTLPALVSDHYSHANAAGTAPGTAQQMERTYWTAAFGLSRWEKWARTDWTGGTEAVPALARALRAGGTCNAPHPMPAAPGMQTGPLQTAGVWSQVIRDAATGAQYTWMMVDCDDHTHLIRSAPAALPAVPASYGGWWKD